LASLILVVNVVGELQRKRTLAASRGFLAAARFSCQTTNRCYEIRTRSSLTGPQIPERYEMCAILSRFVCIHKSLSSKWYKIVTTADRSQIKGCVSLN